MVGLVQYQDLQVGKGDGSPVDVVDEAPGAGDDDIDAPPELLDLGINVDPRRKE